MLRCALLFDMEIIDFEWDKGAESDEEIELKLVSTISNMDSGLWEDIVKFLNKYTRENIHITKWFVLEDFKKNEVSAKFWMEDFSQNSIGCEFHWEEDEPVGYALFLKNPMKKKNST